VDVIFIDRPLTLNPSPALTLTLNPTLTSTLALTETLTLTPTPIQVDAAIIDRPIGAAWVKESAWAQQMRMHVSLPIVSQAGSPVYPEDGVRRAVAVAGHTATWNPSPSSSPSPNPKCSPNSSPISKPSPSSSPSLSPNLTLRYSSYVEAVNAQILGFVNTFESLALEAKWFPSTSGLKANATDEHVEWGIVGAALASIATYILFQIFRAGRKRVQHQKTVAMALSLARSAERA